MPEGERNGYTLYRKGVCLQSLERNPEAMSAFQEAIELDEELDEAWIELAVLHGTSVLGDPAVQGALRDEDVRVDFARVTTPRDRVAVIAEKKIIAVGTIPELIATKHPWIEEYFGGPRGRAAHDAHLRSQE